MKNLIVANWKCNPINLKEAKKLFNQISKKAKVKNTDVVVCPPFIYIDALVRLPRRSLGVGGQNVCFEEKGAFTGEVSALMLKDLEASFVIVGHSERRKYFNETNLQINGKIKNSLEAGLKPILCIGETKQEFEAHLKPEVLETQIIEALKDITKEQVKKIVIVYEPVWAISTSGSESCSIDETMTSILFIRKIISEKYNREIADNMQIIYGGSVTSFNSREYIKNAGANGLLVGGASLNAEEFIKIVKSVE